MKLFYLQASPFVRKVMVVAEELGVASRIERLPCAPGPVARDADIIAANPLGQVPTLMTDDGESLFDSRVICEYLDATFGDGRIFPRGGATRWRALREQSVADGLLGAAILVRYETMLRPEALRWDDWKSGQLDKIASCLAAIEASVEGHSDRVDIGTITTGCALGYLDYRFAHLGWRKPHPRAAEWFVSFSRHPAMRMSEPPAV